MLQIIHLYITGDKPLSIYINNSKDTSMKPYIVLCVFLMVQVCEASEPYCRQYEYDEKMLSKMIRTEFALETLTKGMESLQSDIDTKLQTIRDELETVRTKPAIQPQPSSAGPIGFTVTRPDTTKPNDKIIIFKDVITNEGDGFNMGTGKFTCKHPGLYYFSVVIFRNSGTTLEAFCRIMVNGKSTYPFAYAHSVDSGTYPTGSANLLVQLVEGDEVYLSECHGIDKFHAVTHFSGFHVN